MSELLTKQQLYRLQQKWLSLFEGTEVHWVLNTEIKVNGIKPKGEFEGYFYTPEDAFETNWITSVSHCYTPNGNFAKANSSKSPWEKSLRKETDAENMFFVFMIDLDKKSPGHPNAPDYSEEDLLAILKREKLPIQYITATPGGWHMYMFINPEDRIAFEKKVYSELQTAFATRMDADNLKDVSRLMRVPFSKYWKWGTDQGYVKLYSVEITSSGDYELDEVTSPDQIILPEYGNWNIQQITQLYETITEKMVISNSSSEDKFFDKKSWGFSDFTTQCNLIKMDKIINALSRYPRWNEREKMLEYPVLVNKTIIGLLRIDSNGEMLPIYETDGYRVNQAENYINNLSETYSKQERPKGWPYAFMHGWFYGSNIKIYEFFEKEFGMKRRAEDNNLYLTVEASRGVIDFTAVGVTYTVTVMQKEKTTSKVIKMMHMGCYPKAIIKTKWNSTKSESDTENQYILLTTVRGEDVLIPYHTDKRAFNKVHWSHGMQFIADEVCLNDWYDAVWKAAERAELPIYQYYGTNGFYEDGFLYGQDWFPAEWGVKNISEMRGKYYGNVKHQATFENKLRVSVESFYNDIDQMFPKRVGLIAFLAFITGMTWIEFWKPVTHKINSTKMIPGMLMSGITQSGKTTLAWFLKDWCWICPDARTVGVKAITPQPLQQLSTDNIPLFLTEFTGIIPCDREWNLRDILNKDGKMRWNSDASNSHYIYRSSLMIDGERLPSEESLTNRLIIVPFFSSDKKGKPENITLLRQKTYIFDLVKQIYANWNNVEKYYLEGMKTLAGCKFDDRELQLYSFLYVINKIFGLATNEELISAIKENMAILQSFEKADTLDEILSEIIIEERIVPILYENFECTEWTLWVPLPTHLVAKNRIKLAECIKKYAWAVKIENSCLILEKNKIDLITAKIAKFSYRAISRDTSLR